MKFFVPGAPAPQGSKTRGKHGGLYESSKAVGPWRERVALVAAAQPLSGDAWQRGETRTEGPALGPIRLAAEFVFERPKAHYRTNGEVKLTAPERPAVRPDIDKLCRAILDALTGILLASDAQVVELRATKEYGPAPGCWVTVEPL